MKSTTLALALGLAVGLAGCGVVNSTGHCDFRPGEGRCQEREGLVPTISAFEATCKALPGSTYGSGACARAGVIGGCDLSEVGNPVRDWYYPNPKNNVTTADQVKKECAGKPFLTP